MGLVLGICLIGSSIFRCIIFSQYVSIYDKNLTLLEECPLLSYGTSSGTTCISLKCETIAYFNGTQMK